jgi:hypothetical protein
LLVALSHVFDSRGCEAAGALDGWLVGHLQDLSKRERDWLMVRSHQWQRRESAVIDTCVSSASSYRWCACAIASGVNPRVGRGGRKTGTSRHRNGLAVQRSTHSAAERQSAPSQKSGSPNFSPQYLPSQNAVDATNFFGLTLPNDNDFPTHLL